jgi:DNA polymerase family A
MKFNPVNLFNDLPIETFTDAQYLITRLEEIDYSVQYSITGHPEAVNQWSYYHKGFKKWFPLGIGQNPPSGIVCFDVETTQNTQKLSLGVLIHLEHQAVYGWLSDPESPALLDLAPNTLHISHRSCFENSFIQSNYKPTESDIKGLCTHAIAAQELHPLKPSLIRAMPDLPMFSESADLSLSGLHEHFIGIPLDKGFVDVFKHPSTNPSNWLYLNFDFSWIFTLKLNWILDLNLIEKFKMFVDYQIKTIQGQLDSAFQYCFGDDVATIKVFSHEIDIIKRMLAIEEFTFLGLIARSTPILFLDPQFLNHVEKIENQYHEIRDRVNNQAHQIVKDYIQECLPEGYPIKEIKVPKQETVYAKKNLKKYSTIPPKPKLLYILDQEKLNRLEQNDGQDWSPHGARTNKSGLPSWYDPKNFGLTKRSTAVAMKIKYKGSPLKNIKSPVPSKENKKNDRFVRDFDLEDKRLTGIWYTHDGFPLDNPTNVTKDFLNITNFFSKGLLPDWENGTFSTDNPHAQKMMKEYGTTAFWCSIRKRAADLLIVQTNYKKFLAVAPRPSLSGAVSGRQIDPFFLVLAKTKMNKLGSELQGFFVAPPGYKFVAFDLDSIQSRVAALLCDAYISREKGGRTTTLLLTEFSQQVFNGNKKDFSTVAHSLGRMAGYNFEKIPKDLQDEGYAKGKNASFGLVFNIGAEKLSKMTNTTGAVGWDLCNGFKGIRNKQTGYHSGGSASGLFNCQKKMSEGYLIDSDTGQWRRGRHMTSSILGRRLPNILSPMVTGRDHIMVKSNVCIQAADVDCMNVITTLVARSIEHYKFSARYTNSVHDYYAWIVREDQIEDFKLELNRIHRIAIEMLLDRWHVNRETVPENIYYPETIDVMSRWCKSEFDAEHGGHTISLPDGFKGITEEEIKTEEEEEEDEILFEFD